jgi:hypothetical protein
VSATILAPTRSSCAGGNLTTFFGCEPLSARLASLLSAEPAKGDGRRILFMALSRGRGILDVASSNVNDEFGERIWVTRAFGTNGHIGNMAFALHDCQRRSTRGLFRATHYRDQSGGRSRRGPCQVTYCPNFFRPSLRLALQPIIGARALRLTCTARPQTFWTRLVDDDTPVAPFWTAAAESPGRPTGGLFRRRSHRGVFVLRAVFSGVPHLNYVIDCKVHATMALQTSLPTKFDGCYHRGRDPHEGPHVGRSGGLYRLILLDWAARDRGEAIVVSANGALMPPPTTAYFSTVSRSFLISAR